MGEQTFIFSAYLKRLVRLCMQDHTMHKSKNKETSKGWENILSDPLFILHNRLTLNRGWADKTEMHMQRCVISKDWIRDEGTRKKAVTTRVTSVTSNAISQHSLWSCKNAENEENHNSGTSSCATYCIYSKLPRCILKQGHHSSCPSGPFSPRRLRRRDARPALVLYSSSSQYKGKDKYTPHPVSISSIVLLLLLLVLLLLLLLQQNCF